MSTTVSVRLRRGGRARLAVGIAALMVLAACSSTEENAERTTNAHVPEPSAPQTRAGHDAEQPEVRVDVGLDHPISTEGALGLRDLAPISELRFDRDGFAGGVGVSDEMSAEQVHENLVAGTKASGWIPGITGIIFSTEDSVGPSAEELTAQVRERAAQLPVQEPIPAPPMEWGR